MAASGGVDLKIARRVANGRRSENPIDAGESGHGKSVPELAFSALRLGDPFAVPAQNLNSAEARSAEARLVALMEAYFDFVWRSLRRLGLGDSDADDGAQEVFLVTSRKLEQITPGSERQFLFATAVRVASTRRRSLKRRREEPLTVVEEHDQEQDQREPGPERLTEMSRARRDLQDILDGMSFEQRSAFISFELEEMTVPEIAATLGLPIGTVSSRLRAAREHFQTAIGRLHTQRAFAKGRS